VTQQTQIKAQSRDAVVRAHGEVRGTQSFVGVMSAVWKRPSLTALEILWRWAFGLLAAAAVWIFARDVVMLWVMKFRDIAAILARGRLVGRGAADVHMYQWALVGLIVAWGIFAGLGRGVVLRRWDRSLRAQRVTVMLLALLRAFVYAGVVVLWCTVLVKIAQRTIWGPLTAGAEPAYVPAFAMGVVTTLVLFVFWAAVNWLLRIAPVLAMSRGLGALQSLRAAMQLGPLRSKLIEINLVMGIVKVALTVLALVFSACPLPFESVESQTFLTCWWLGVGVLYLIASDYFHVVRAAAYERLYRAYDGAAADEIR
jgi:hypothetical protein